MASQASLGEVTTATAQGHLPQFRGTGSVSPAMLSVAGFDRDQVHATGKIQSPSVVNGSTFPFKSSKPLSENNRPLSRAIPIVRPPDSLDAEGYMRLVQKKQEPSKTGPVMGSDW